MAITQVKTTGLADDAVTQDKVANDAIDITELKGRTDGHILTYDASGNPTSVGPGTDGQVLTSTGAGSPPAFEAIPAGGATINNATENEIVTVASTTSQLDAEAKFTYDGNTAVLQTTSDGNAINVVRNSADANPVNITLTKSRNATYGSNTVVNNADVLGEIVWKADDGTDYATEAAAIRVDVDGAPGGNDMPSRMEFFTTADGAATASKRLTINNAGNVQVEDGNLQILTAGHGVEFSAFGASNANLLDDYEEGTCAMTYTPGSGTLTIGDDDLSYTKIGQRVFISGYLSCTGHSSATGWLRINGLPFTVLSGGGANNAHHIGVIYFRGGDSTPGSTGNYGEFPVTYKVDANQTYIDAYAVYGGLLDSGDQSICQYIGESTFIYLNFSYITA